MKGEYAFGPMRQINVKDAQIQTRLPIVRHVGRECNGRLDIFRYQVEFRHDRFGRIAFRQACQDHADHHPSPFDARLTVAHVGPDTDPLLPVHESSPIVSR